MRIREIDAPAPRVPSNPVVGAVLRAPPVELNGVVDCERGARVVHVNPRCVSLNAVSVQISGDRASCKDFGHDILISLDTAVLANLDGRVRLLGEAAFAG